MSERIDKLRDEARYLLDCSAAILSGDSVSDANAKRAIGYQAEAKAKIDRAEKLIRIEEMAAKEGYHEVSGIGGYGAGKKETRKEVKKMATKISAPPGTMKNFIEVVREESDQDGGFKDFGEFCRTVYRQKAHGIADNRLKYRSKDMAEGALATGGAIVPAGFLAELLVYEAEASIVEPRAFVIPMTGRDMAIPAIDHSGSTEGKTNYYGGVETYWGEEAGEKTESDVALKKIELVSHKIYAYTQASDELVDDSNPTLVSVLSKILGGAIGHAKDYTYFQGTGVGQPLGIVGAGGTFTQVRAVAANFGYIDAANMFSHFRPSVAGRGAWIMNESLKPEMLTMQDPTGNYIWSPNTPSGAANAPPGTLLGMPVIFTEKLPVLGVTGDVLLCDFSQYLVGVSQEVRLDISKHYKFQNDQTAFRIVARVDGQQWLSAPIVAMDGATQVSPFVELDAATS